MERKDNRNISITSVAEAIQDNASEQTQSDEAVSETIKTNMTSHSLSLGGAESMTTCLCLHAGLNNVRL